MTETSPAKITANRLIEVARRCEDAIHSGARGVLVDVDDLRAVLAALSPEATQTEGEMVDVRTWDDEVGNYVYRTVFRRAALSAVKPDVKAVVGVEEAIIEACLILQTCSERTWPSAESVEHILTEALGLSDHGLTEAQMRAELADPRHITTRSTRAALSPQARQAEGREGLLGGLFIDAWTEYSRAESAFEEFLFTLGIKGTWERMWADFYDNSVEFGDVDNDETFTPEQAQAILESGVSRFWLRHKDGSETAYWHDTTGGTQKARGLKGVRRQRSAAAPAPPVEPRPVVDREQIARIIDPEAFVEPSPYARGDGPIFKAEAYEKADAILALQSARSGEGGDHE